MLEETEQEYIKRFVKTLYLERFIAMAKTFLTKYVMRKFNNSESHWEW